MLFLQRLAVPGLLSLILFIATACYSSLESSTDTLQETPTIAQTISTRSLLDSGDSFLEQRRTQTPLTYSVVLTSVMTPSTTKGPMVSLPEAVRPSLTRDLPTQTPTPTATVPYTDRQVLGTSVEGRDIEAYQFNNGPNHLVFVGGMHGGYEWNTILLAYEAISYFQEHPELVPDTVTLTIVPSANPDGQYLVTGKEGRFLPDDVASDTVDGRFNANGVDLNRNWDCNWTEGGVWREHVVQTGTGAFSEKETRILRDFFLAVDPATVIFWHSAANGVFAAGCTKEHQASSTLARIYGDAAGYPVLKNFDHYPVTGDASDWLTTQGISSITVELQNHKDLDWPQNLQGILIVLESYR